MKAEGKRGAYLCYNKMIAETVKTVFENEGNNIDVYTLPGILMKCNYSEPALRKDEIRMT